MHSLLTVGAVLAASISTVSAGNACASGTAQNIGGNWYCDGAVRSITYNNFGSSGTYNDITSMDGGSCTSAPKAYSGPLAPLNDEHSFHLRGPVTLKKFAVYSPGDLFGKRETIKPSFHERRHAHHTHAVRAKEQKKVTGPVRDKPTVENKGAAGLGGFRRQAFFDAEKGEADGLTFLNHHGGEGSGVFDYVLGNSLSYASSDGLTGSSSPQVLKDITLPDNKEIVIMSDKKCNGDCGTVRPGTVDYHGFSGASKLYLIELAMPKTGKTGFNMDMPAAWILNAKIPRTLQYGKAECSCWPECGEFDILEVLDSGNDRAKSTFHGKIAGGDSHFFQRPAGAPIKVAVLFNELTSAAHIKVLDDDFDFGSVIDLAKIALLEAEAALSSIFTLGS